MDAKGSDGECPFCGTQGVKEETYRLRCGYDFGSKREGVGPISFSFADTGFAYKPSGKRDFLRLSAYAGVGRNRRNTLWCDSLSLVSGNVSRSFVSLC